MKLQWERDYSREKDDFYRLVYRPVYPYFIDAHDGKAFMSKTYNKRRLAGVEKPRPPPLVRSNIVLGSSGDRMVWVADPIAPAAGIQLHIFKSGFF